MKQKTCQGQTLQLILPTVSNKASTFYNISTWGLLLVQVWNSDPEVQGSNLSTAGNSGKQKKKCFS